MTDTPNTEYACVVCREKIVQGPRPVDFTHVHSGDKECWTGDGSTASPGPSDAFSPLPAEFCCRGECCEPGSWCCARAGSHMHTSTVPEETHD